MNSNKTTRAVAAVAVGGLLASAVHHGAWTDWAFFGVAMALFLADFFWDMWLIRPVKMYDFEVVLEHSVTHETKDLVVRAHNRVMAVHLAKLEMPPLGRHEWALNGVQQVGE